MGGRWSRLPVVKIETDEQAAKAARYPTVEWFEKQRRNQAWVEAGSQRRALGQRNSSIMRRRFPPSSEVKKALVVFLLLASRLSTSNSMSS